MCNTQQTSTSSTRWREFGWKTLIRYFITPHITSRFKGSHQHCWRQCGLTDANHSHIFWSCIKLRPFWDSALSVMDRIMTYVVPKEAKVVLLGLMPKEAIPPEDSYIFRILTIACKKAITRNWLKKDPPWLEQWLDIIGEIYTMERLTFYLRLKGHVFEKRWRKWHAYKQREAWNLSPHQCFGYLVILFYLYFYYYYF